jgi:hypothetical protein
MSAYRVTWPGYIVLGVAFEPASYERHVLGGLADQKGANLRLGDVADELAVLGD